jgi:hypothetical protein
MPLNKKKRLLFVWEYARRDLTEPLLRLQDEFDLFFLYRYEQHHDLLRPDFKTIYWNDYESPEEIIRTVAPSKILFGDIETIHEVALNIVARAKKIPTIVLDHGIRYNFKSYLTTESNRAAFKKNKDVHLPEVLRTPAEKNKKQQKKTLFFFLRALKYTGYRQRLPSLRFLFIRATNDINRTQLRCKSEIRMPDRYFLIYNANRNYYLERDGAHIGPRLKLIGDFVHDFTGIKNKHPSENPPYHLLIDAFDVYNENFNIPVADKIRFITVVNTYCKEQQVRLKIKLHPRNFNFTYFPSDPNIDYLKDCDLLDVISGARACFFNSFSSLLPVVIRYKPCILFYAMHRYIYEDLIDTTAFTTLDLHHFTQEEIVFITDEQKRAAYSDRIAGPKDIDSKLCLIKYLNE